MKKGDVSEEDNRVIELVLKGVNVLLVKSGMASNHIGNESTTYTNGTFYSSPRGQITFKYAAGSVGDIRFDQTHLYIAIGDNVWKRVGISTF